MTRPYPCARRGAALAVAAAMLLSPALPAAAQEPPPGHDPEVQAEPERHPVIVRAPQRVRFRQDASVRGRLRRGLPGDVVTLQRRRTGDHGWRSVAARSLHRESRRFRFRLRGLERSRSYRLRWRDREADVANSSESRRIRVRPRLRMGLSTRHAYSGSRVKVRGRLSPRAPGRRVVVQKRTGGDWRRVARPRVRYGRFRAHFRARHRGRRRIRVRFRGDVLNTSARRTRRLRVYGRSLATWYGPGLYGNRTACGQVLRTRTMGVAHRRLPCGTEVRLLYRGRTITVPVIDRGPYSSADWDLTAGTAARLDFSGRNLIGVIP